MTPKTILRASLPSHIGNQREREDLVQLQLEVLAGAGYAVVPIEPTQKIVDGMSRAIGDQFDFRDAWRGGIRASQDMKGEG